MTQWFRAASVVGRIVRTRAALGSRIFCRQLHFAWANRRLDMGSLLESAYFPRLGSGHIACVGISLMRRISSLLFVVAFSAGTIASLPCVCAKDTIDAWSVSAGAIGTCGDRYNALVANAKLALVNGDQHAALHGLIAAKEQLRSCEERDHDIATGAAAIALNSPRLSEYFR